MKNSPYVLSPPHPLTLSPPHLLLLALACLTLPAQIAGQEPPAAAVVEEKLPNGAAALFIHNPHAYTITATLDVTLVNASASEKLPVVVVVPPNSRKGAVVVQQADPQAAWRYSFTWNHAKGNIQASHDKKAVYHLPYPAGQQRRVLQGYDGAFSHKGEYQFSIDWEMPIGSQVCAARGGRVVDIKVDSKESGQDRAKFADKSNFILIEHPDGTLGAYLHLNHQGAQVKLGQTVKAGDPIAFSGNTGQVTAPHLHFHVQVPAGKNIQTLPIKFRIASRKSEFLEAGKSYTSLAP